MRKTYAAIFVAALLLPVSACQRGGPSEPSVTGRQAGSHDDHGHDHSHGGHAHEELGPHGGHLVDLGGEYRAEWLHDDATGQVTVLLLAQDGRTEVRTSAESITLEVSIGGNARRYELKPADRGEDPATASEFHIVDRPLVEALKAVGHGVEAFVVAEIDGQTLRGEIEHHHDHHHGHAH